MLRSVVHAGINKTPREKANISTANISKTLQDNVDG